MFQNVKRTCIAHKNVSKCQTLARGMQKCFKMPNTCGLLLVDVVVARTTVPKSNTHMREEMTPCYVLSLFVFDTLSPNVTEFAHLFLSPKEMTKDILVSFRP